jgi:6-carboxyhexanoate--CoA ligase
MDKKNLYSIRMRASAGARHISGAERIVSAVRVDATVNELVSRALDKGCRPDRITVAVDALGSAPVRKLTSLDVVTLNVPDVPGSRMTAFRILERTGISTDAVKIAINLLANGPSASGGTMRGAMILDALNGERLDPDRERGIRASRFDWSDEASKKIDRTLSDTGLTHFRTREALALATKVAHAPGIVAELCWSDDPDYTAGYVASLSTGYVRFPFLKPKRDDHGGRAFFVRHDGFDLVTFVKYLREEPVLITDIGICGPSMDTEDFMKNL